MFKEKYCKYLDIDFNSVEDYFIAQGYKKVEKKNDNILIFRVNKGIVNKCRKDRKYCMACQHYDYCDR